MAAARPPSTAETSHPLKTGGYTLASAQTPHCSHSICSGVRDPRTGSWPISPTRPRTAPRSPKRCGCSITCTRWLRPHELGTTEASSYPITAGARRLRLLPQPNALPARIGQGPGLRKRLLGRNIPRRLQAPAGRNRHPRALGIERLRQHGPRPAAQTTHRPDRSGREHLPRSDRSLRHGTRLPRHLGRRRHLCVQPGSDALRTRDQRAHLCPRYRHDRGTGRAAFGLSPQGPVWHAGMPTADRQRARRPCAPVSAVAAASQPGHVRLGPEQFGRAGDAPGVRVPDRRKMLSRDS